MRRRGKSLILSAVILLSIMPFVQAEIFISSPKPLYNVGDNFDVTITLQPSETESDFLLTSLICEGNEVEIFKSPYTLSPGDKKEVTISTNLGTFLTEGKEGQCYIKSTFGNDVEESPTFELSRKIDVSLNINGIVFNPGDTVTLTGKAIKANGELLNGFVEVQVSETNYKATGESSNGDFSFTFSVPENAKSGAREISVIAYEKDEEGETINEGEAENILKIKQILTNIDIALSTQTIKPESALEYKVMIYDQAGDEVATDATITIKRPDKSESENKLIKTYDSNSFYIDSNFSSGYWTIEAKTGNLAITKQLYVEEYTKLSYSLQNGTLYIKNDGNVPFSGPLEITIGDTKEIKEIENLKVGETKKYRLKAPDGEYSISIGQSALGTTFLTGRAISIDEAGNLLKGNYIFILTVLVIIVLLFIAVFLIRKKIKSRPKTESKNKFTPSEFSKSAELAATATAIDQGQKQEASIISLKIKNPEALYSKEIADIIDSALWKAKEAGAKIYTQGDYKIMVFVPMLTKLADNSTKAINVAKGIERVLSEYKKRGIKLDFGIGVNSGELVVESKEGKFKFMSVDNTISTTKNVASQSNGEVLLSKNIHRKTIGKIKTSKLMEGDLWRVEKVMDRSEHSEYVRKFSK